MREKVGAEFEEQRQREVSKVRESHHSASSKDGLTQGTAGCGTK